MKRSRWLIILALAAALAAGAQALAQQRADRDPHIGYAFPAGGRPGTEFDIVVGGQYLKSVTEGFISGGGAEVKVGKHYQHMARGEYIGLSMKIRFARERLEEIAEKKGRKERVTLEEVHKEAGVTQEDLDRMAEYRKRDSDPKRQLNPQLMEETTLHVTFAANAKPGERELRLISPSGMSNPVYVHVSQSPEYRETEPNDVKPDPVVAGNLPTVANGQIMPGDVDRFSFQAKRGQRLVLSGAARELMPYLADAVPGWFQAVLALYDAGGKELAYANAFGFHQDPVIYFEVPQDGEYIVEIRDAIYRGREDFVYRLTIGEFPYITNIFPLGGRAGTPVTANLYGWNLPTDKFTLDTHYDRGQNTRFLQVKTPAGIISNRVAYAVEMQPEIFEQESNDANPKAQKVALPVIVNGHIDSPDDVDVFRFEGTKNEPFVAEVYARRLNSPLDSLLRLFDAGGVEVAASDDNEDKGAALITHHADSRLAIKLPSTGTFYLRMADAQRKGGKEYAYRLSIRPPRPDFELRVVPSSVIAHAGGSVPITVYVLRRDGFDDDVALELENAPKGFQLSGAWAPAGLDKIRMTLTVPQMPSTEPLSLTLRGQSMNRSRRFVHTAVPAEAMMQAFAYHHLVPAKDWTVAVTGKTEKPKIALRQDRVKLSASQPVQIGALLAQGMVPSDIRMELSEPPDGISIQKVTPDPSGVIITLKAEGKAKVGLKGNLIFNAFTERSYVNAEGKKSPPQKRLVGMLPAITFEVGK